MGVAVSELLINDVVMEIENKCRAYADTARNQAAELPGTENTLKQPRLKVLVHKRRHGLEIHCLHPGLSGVDDMGRVSEWHGLEIHVDDMDWAPGSHGFEIHVDDVWDRFCRRTRIYL
jgi:hypothetical protein